VAKSSNYSFMVHKTERTFRCIVFFFSKKNEIHNPIDFFNPTTIIMIDARVALVDGSPSFRIVSVPELHGQVFTLASFESEEELRRSPLFERVCGSSDASTPRIALLNALGALGSDAIADLMPDRLAVLRNLADDADLAIRTLDVFSHIPYFSTLSFETMKDVVRAFAREKMHLVGARFAFEELLSKEARERLNRDANREIRMALLARLDACENAADLNVLLRTYRMCDVPSESMLAFVGTFYNETMQREYSCVIARFLDRELAALSNALPSSLVRDVWERVLYI
jgi:hypothetical protein